MTRRWVDRRAAARWMRTTMVVALYGVIAVALLGPSASNEVLPTATDIPPHIGAIVQARMALDEGQFPPRVAPWQHTGWRYPVFQFYSPLPYSVAGLLYAWIVPSNPYVAYKIGIWLAMVLGATFIYRLASWLTGSRPAALLAGATYLAAPYLLMNIHARGAFPEVAAQGILPAVLYYSLRSYVRPGIRPIAVAAAAWCALALTHTIVFIYGSLFGGLWFLLLGGRPRKTLSRLARLGTAYGLSWLLAAYFLVPVLSSDYVRVRDHINNPYDLSWYTPLAALLSPVSVPPEPQPARDIGAHVNPAVGWPLLIAWGVMLHALLTRPGDLRRRAAVRFAAPLLVLAGVAFFMVWSPFDFWSALPASLHVTQYTYRLLTHVMWPCALLAAYAVVVLFDGRLDGRHVAVGLLAVGLASGSFLPALTNGRHRIDLLMQQPDMGYGRNDYLIKERLYLDADLAGGVNVPLTFHDAWLLLSTDLDVQSLRPYASSPLTMRVVGEVPKNLVPNVRLSASIDGTRLASIQLEPGPFVWEVPLSRGLAARSRGPASGPLKLRFESDRTFRLWELDPAWRDTRNWAVNAFRVVIDGLPPERTVLTVDRVQPACAQDGPETVCRLDVPAATGLVQLPILYYPELLDVRMDGQPVAYRPVHDRGALLATVEAAPGQHEVRVRFQGIVWANWVSGVAWLGVLAAVVVSFIRRPVRHGARRSARSAGPVGSVGSVVRSAARRLDARPASD